MAKNNTNNAVNQTPTTPEIEQNADFAADQIRHACEVLGISEAEFIAKISARLGLKITIGDISNKSRDNSLDIPLMSGNKISIGDINVNVKIKKTKKNKKNKKK